MGSMQSVLSFLFVKSEAHLKRQVLLKRPKDHDEKEHSNATLGCTLNRDLLEVAPPWSKHSQYPTSLTRTLRLHISGQEPQVVAHIAPMVIN